MIPSTTKSFCASFCDDTVSQDASSVAAKNDSSTLDSLTTSAALKVSGTLKRRRRDSLDADSTPDTISNVTTAPTAADPSKEAIFAPTSPLTPTPTNPQGKPLDVNTSFATSFPEAPEGDPKPEGVPSDSNEQQSVAQEADEDGYDSDTTIPDDEMNVIVDNWSNESTYDVVDPDTNQKYTCILGRVCAHPIHPAHTGYKEPFCPVCTLHGQLNTLKEYKPIIEKRGGIFRSRFYGAGDDPERLELHDYPVSPEHRAYINKRGNLDTTEKPTNRTYWRRDKVNVANLEIRLTALRDIEVEWKAEIPDKGGKKRGHFVFDDYSAAKALKLLEAFKDDYRSLYLPGDPALGILDAVSEQTATKEKEADNRAHRRKRRKIEHRFDDTVTVSAPHVVNGPQGSITAWAKTLKKGNTTVALKGPRVGVSNSNAWTWGRHGGYEKADTSFAKLKPEEVDAMQMELCEDAPEEVQTKASVNSTQSTMPEPSVKATESVRFEEPVEPTASLKPAQSVASESPVVPELPIESGLSVQPDIPVKSEVQVAPTLNPTVENESHHSTPQVETQQVETQQAAPQDWQEQIAWHQGMSKMYEVMGFLGRVQNNEFNMSPSQRDEMERCMLVLEMNVTQWKANKHS
jgi:hypothetical protein